MLNPNCSVCGKPYEFSNRTWSVKGKWYCEHDLAAIGPDKLVQARKENADRTSEALRMADRARKEQNAADPMVTIQKPRDTGVSDNQFTGPAQVRKSTLDKLTEKAEQALDMTPPQ